MNLPTLLAAFSSAGVEFFETAAIAYALARSGFFREAVMGTALGLVVVAVASLFSWPFLEKIPVHIFQGCIGIMLILIGTSWTIKSVKRKLQHRRARWISDPLAVCGSVVEDQPSGFSPLNMLLMAKSAAFEGLEVAIIVVSLGVATRAWFEITLGASIAFAATIVVVALLHGRLQKLPEVAIKLGTGIVLLVMGVFWVSEGIQTSWSILKRH